MLRLSHVYFQIWSYLSSIRQIVEQSNRSRQKLPVQFKIGSSCPNHDSLKCEHLPRRSWRAAERPQAEAETGVAVVFRLCNANLTLSPPHLRAVIGYFLPVGGPTLAQNRSHFTQFDGIMPSRGRGRWLLSQFRYHVIPST